MAKVLKIKFLLIPVLFSIFLIAFWFYISNQETAPFPQTSLHKIVPTLTVTPIKIITFPIDNYYQRLKLRTFGQYLNYQDVKTVPCGQPFTGFHTGDDLETFPDEANNDIPVFSIAQGEVIEVNYVSGYGGLIVALHRLVGESVTAYYGHINLDSATVKVGDMVSTGQKLADLGQGCSTQTDGERKHLHFALHKGAEIDVRGYVQTQDELNSWINPSDEFKR